jgi:putative ABC transport system permease protein
MGIYLVIALRNLLQAKRRTFFLGGALTMVAALLVLLLSLAQGLTDNMIHYSTTLASGHVNVGGFFKLSPGDVAPLVQDAPKIRQIVKEEIPEAVMVLDRNRGWSKLVSETGAMWTSPVGINPAEEHQLKAALKLAPESAYKKDGGEATHGDISKIGQPGKILLFASQAKKLEVGVGDQITVVAETMRGATNSGDFEVVAVVQDMGMMSQWSAFVPKSALHELYRTDPDTTGAVMIFLDDIAKTEAVLARLQKVLPERGYTVLEHKSEPFWQKLEQLPHEDWTGARLDLTTWEDEASFLKWVITAFNGVSFFLVGILLLIIVIGIMNTMFMSVRERTGEVGTLRAIGMGRGRVLGMFLTEALLLGFAASTLGGLLGGGIALALDAATISVPSDAARMILLSDTIHLAAQSGHVIAAVVIFTCVTALSALYPAYRAARMRPVTAIHHVS